MLSVGQISLVPAQKVILFRTWQIDNIFFVLCIEFSCFSRSVIHFSDFASFLRFRFRKCKIRSENCRKSLFQTALYQKPNRNLNIQFQMSTQNLSINTVIYAFALKMKLDYHSIIDVSYLIRKLLKILIFSQTCSSRTLSNFLHFQHLKFKQPPVLL